MDRSTNKVGPALKYALYKEAMKVLELKMGKKCWAGGWPLLRARGKKILHNDRATDDECAEAIIFNRSVT